MKNKMNIQVSGRGNGKTYRLVMQAFINKNNLFDRIEKLFVLRKGEE